MSKEAMKLALEALELANGMLERADCSTGYCCCGSLVDGHTIGDGHSPVDEGEYFQSKAIRKSQEAIKALEEALAKQEQGEPHSWYSAQEDEWMTEKVRKDHERLNSYTHKVGGFDLPLYTTPQQRKPLTDELADALKTVLKWVDDFCETDEHFAESVEAKADAALEKYEAAHGIKE